MYFFESSFTNVTVSAINRVELIISHHLKESIKVLFK